LGPVALCRELIPHHLDSDLIEKLLQAAYLENPEEELIERLLVKRNIEPGTKLPLKEKNKVIKYLQRRGHRWEIIRSVLEENFSDIR